MFEEGHNLFQAGDVDGALSKLSKVLQLQPEHGKAHYLMGLCFVNKDDKTKAKEHLQKFVDLSPSDPDVAAAKSMLDYL
jgi:Flp pilus assembly protein TadD